MAGIVDLFLTGMKISLILVKLAIIAGVSIIWLLTRKKTKFRY